MVSIDTRPTAHYRGDTSSTVGQVVGPTMAGEFLVVDEVDYDAAADRSTARFRYATTEDLQAIPPTVVSA